MKLGICVLSINRDMSLSHFDKVLKHGGLRSFKYGGDFGITLFAPIPIPWALANSKMLVKNRHI